MPERHRAFELFLRAARPVLVQHHGEAFAARVVVDARGEYERVLPEVPDIGGRRNVFQPVMTINGWLAALHRGMRAHGGNAEDSIRVGQAVFDGWLRKLPRFALTTIGRLLLSGPARSYFERQAARSQERRHPEDFVWKVEQGGDGEFSFVFDECAVNKWYDAQDLRDLKPYCNFADVTYSRLMGMGVDASETIGLGCPQCALRFKHGRETAIPSSLEGIVSR
ncbi:MAG: L-2-amino-thiazoline-4-carboxylic acid hydrolase [Myxococcales bacterium]|nr:L-2-amino-thiazoline-4-carboxylic acid hydrolase [Myxococcales bacterium]